MTMGADVGFGEQDAVGEAVDLSWRYPDGLIGLSFWNFFARVVTLGIYHFWGKTEVRRRLWSGIRLNGEPLVYTGRGSELLLGFVIVFFLIVLPLLMVPLAAVLYFGPESPYSSAVELPLYVLFFFLFGVAVYRAQRYRLSRTLWRGIRGRLVGSSLAYAWQSFWTGLLVPFTLGWILPWRAVQLQKRLTDEMRFGSEAFSFHGSSGPLYKRFAILWFGSIVLYFVVMGVIGVGMMPSYLEFKDIRDHGGTPPAELTIWIIGTIYGGLIVAFLLYSIGSAWYRARVINHFAQATNFSALQMHGDIKARGLIYIAITNFLIRLLGSVIFLTIGAVIAFWAYTILSGLEPPASQGEDWDKVIRGATALLGIFALLLGLAGYSLFAPITEARRMGYIVERIGLTGSVTLDQIMQGSQQNIRAGEGLAEAFDIDAF